MRCRALQQSDIPALRAMAEASGYPYPEISDFSTRKEGTIEAVLVVADDQDQPVMACAAQRIVELYLFVGDGGTPALKLHALRLLHDSMAAALRAKGYQDANAFLPPSIAAKFGRRLERTFGWVRNWQSWCRSVVIK